MAKHTTITVFRHIIQIIVFIALNAKLLGIASTRIIVPYLHASQAPFSTAIGGLESLEFTLARGLFPLLSLGVLYLTAITVGRLFCGWACPVGFVQDLLSYLPFKKQRLSGSTEYSLKDLNAIILGFSIFVSVLVGFRRATDPEQTPAGAFSDSPFGLLSPSGTLFAYIPWMILWKSNVIVSGGLTVWLKLFFFVAVIVPSLYVPRFFCRYVCPLGALLGSVSQFKLLRINRNLKTADISKANKVLDNVCPTKVRIKDEETFIGSSRCIHCGNCVVAEPTIFSQN